MWFGLGATFFLLASSSDAATLASPPHAAHGAKRRDSKAETAFLTTLRRALNEELRSKPVQPVAQPPPAARDDEERAEDEREEAEAEKEARDAREELQRIEEQSRTQASIRQEAVRDEQTALGKEQAALHATATAASAPVAVASAVPASMPQNSGSPLQVAPQPATVPTLPQQVAPSPMAATAVPQQSTIATLPIALPVAPQITGNTSQIDSEKTAQLAANIAKVARWKDAQATQVMESAKAELARVESDGRKAEEAKDYYEKLQLKAQQYVKEAAADREAAQAERKKAEDARTAAEWEAERANGARVQAEQDWQRAQLMQKDAEAAQAQVEKQQAELKKETLEASLEMRKAEEAHAKSERERAELRLEEMAFQRLEKNFMAQSKTAAQAPSGSAPPSSIAIAGEQVRGFGSQSQTVSPQTPMAQAVSSSEAVSKVVLDAAKDVLGPNAPLAPLASHFAVLPPVQLQPPAMASVPQAQYQAPPMPLTAYAIPQAPIVNPLVLKEISNH